MPLKTTAGIGLLAAVAISALVFGYRIPPKTQAGSTAEQEVRQVESARRDALLRNDVAALDRLIADSYLATLADGRVTTKAEALAVNQPGERQVESWNQTDLVIRVYGDTAVVTGLIAEKDRITAGSRAS